jgi:hypothetical protein
MNSAFEDFLANLCVSILIIGAVITLALQIASVNHPIQKISGTVVKKECITQDGGKTLNGLGG